jgi:hypothetical protein
MCRRSGLGAGQLQFCRGDIRRCTGRPSVRIYSLSCGALLGFQRLCRIRLLCIRRQACNKYPNVFKPGRCCFFASISTQYRDPLTLPFRKNYKEYPHSKIEGTGPWCCLKCVSIQSVPESAERQGGGAFFFIPGDFAGRYRAPLCEDSCLSEQHAKRAQLAWFRRLRTPTTALKRAGFLASRHAVRNGPTIAVRKYSYRVPRFANDRFQGRLR